MLAREGLYVTSRRATSNEHLLRVDAILRNGVLDHVRDRVGISATIMRERGLARHIPALGCRTRPYSHIAFSVGTLLPRDFGVSEIFLCRGLARVNGNNKCIAFHSVRLIHPPSLLVSFSMIDSLDTKFAYICGLAFALPP